MVSFCNDLCSRQFSRAVLCKVGNVEQELFRRHTYAFRDAVHETDLHLVGKVKLLTIYVAGDGDEVVTWHSVALPCHCYQTSSGIDGEFRPGIECIFESDFSDGEVRRCASLPGWREIHSDVLGYLHHIRIV